MRVRAMTIGLILDPYGERQPGGLGRSIFEIARALIRAAPHTALTIYLKKDPAQPPAFPPGAWTIRPLRVRSVLFSGARRIDKGLDWYLFLTSVIPLWWRPKKSIVMAFDFAYLEEATTLQSRLRAWLLYYVHRRSFRLATTVVAISHATAHEVTERFGIPPEKVVAIPIGFIPLTAATESYEVAHPYFFFAGVIKNRKNIEGIIRAFGHFCAGTAEPHHLVLAGKTGGQYYERLRALVHELGLQEKVLFIGYVSDAELSFLYRNATAFVFPSHIEGFGMPILEAMDVGTPVITSNKGALAEVAGDAALLTDPTDHEALARAMARLVNDPTTRREMVQKGTQRAAQFTWERFARRLLACMEQDPKLP